jgi:hypothetical protein
MEHLSLCGTAESIRTAKRQSTRDLQQRIQPKRDISQSGLATMYAIKNE